MNIREAIQLKPAEFTLSSGEKYILLRPSALDLVEVLETVKTSPNKVPFILIYKHLMDENGNKVFNSPEEVEQADGQVVNQIYINIDKLYGEGRS